MSDRFFSPEEAELMHKFYPLYKEFHEGTRQPVTDSEKHFVEVCHGRQSPETKHEKLYLKILEVAKVNPAAWARQGPAKVRAPWAAGGLRDGDNWDESAIK